MLGKLIGEGGLLEWHGSSPNDPRQFYTIRWAEVRFRTFVAVVSHLFSVTPATVGGGFFAKNCNEASPRRICEERFERNQAIQTHEAHDFTRRLAEERDLASLGLVVVSLRTARREDIGRERGLRADERLATALEAISEQDGKWYRVDREIISLRRWSKDHTAN